VSKVCPICGQHPVMGECRNTNHYWWEDYFRWTVDGVSYGIQGDQFWIGNNPSSFGLTNSIPLPSKIEFDPKNPSSLIERLKVLASFR